MAINITLGEVKTQKEKDFPKLMVWCNKDEFFIVLFTLPKKGVVVSSNIQQWNIGDYDDDFDPKQFTDYNEPITLQNQQ